MAAAMYAEAHKADGGPFCVDRDRPFAQRSELMSLDVVRSRDVPAVKPIFPRAEDLSLKTEDIEGSKPQYRHLNYLNKPDFSVGSTNPDHHGGRARSYYAPMDRRPRDLSLTTADIEGAQSSKATRRSNRHTDPVCPQYELPSSYKPPVPEPRFNGRHLHDISDIEKSSSKVLHPTRNYCKDPNDSTDIEYSSSRYQEKVLGRTREVHNRTLDVRDICDTKRTKPRDTNPLDPQYKVSTAPHTSLYNKYSEERKAGLEVVPAEFGHIGEVHGSKSRQLHRDNGEPQLSLVREDIAGTVPQRYVGSVPANIYDDVSVRPAISFHDPGDIAGTQVGSLRKGLERNQRVTNPMNPRYQSLDGDRRPLPVPTIDAERGAPGGSQHPSLLNSRTGLGSTSLPNLRSTVGGSPCPSGAPSSRAGSELQRDRSEAILRGSLTLGGSAANLSTMPAAGTPAMDRSRRSSRAASSGCATPAY